LSRAKTPRKSEENPRLFSLLPAGSFGLRSLAGRPRRYFLQQPVRSFLTAPVVNETQRRRAGREVKERGDEKKWTV
jgi:hypothetical protein